MFCATLAFVVLLALTSFVLSVLCAAACLSHLALSAGIPLLLRDILVVACCLSTLPGGAVVHSVRLLDSLVQLLYLAVLRISASASLLAEDLLLTFCVRVFCLIVQQ